MGMVVDNKFSHGETVYLKTDKEQLPRVVFCIKIFPSGILYEVTSGITTSAHYDFELYTEKDTIMQTT